MNTQSANLSGGNKRKLCVANALIGSPQLLFLDEPSTGLDPLAKKYLWNLLYSTVRNRNASMLLTTHTLTEAEYLSDKIGIMINGEFKCFGTLVQLKNKYGRGIRITLKACPDFTIDSIALKFSQEYPNAKRFGQPQ